MSKRALVVDNDFFFLEFLCELLEKRGYEIVKAHDGKEGVVRLNEGPVDLLFMEIILPKIDGRQLIKYARRKFQKDALSIIVVSGYLVEQMDVLDEIGADYYIAKGAMEKMGDHIEGFFDELEKAEASNGLSLLLEPGQVFPRQSTAHLLDMVNYQASTIECAGVGILVADTDGRILRANASALAILKRSFESILNCPVTGLFPAGERDEIVEALKTVILDESHKKQSFTIQRDSDMIRATVSVFDMNGKKLGWVIALDEMAENGSNDH